MTPQQAQTTMKWWIGTLLTVSLVMLSGVVWAVRQEGRINGIENQHKTDMEYIKEDVREIKDIQHKILEKI